jgi:hypothetical protein
MRSRRFLSMVAAVLLVPAAAAFGQTLMIVGGGPQPAALVQQFVDLAGGRG